MKKKGLQLISVFLILSIGLSVCNLAYAETADTDQNIEAFNVDVITDIDTQTESLQMLWSEGDLYIRTSDVEKVTRYQYVNMNEDYVIYKLGEKYIDFSLKDDRVLMPEQSYTGKYGGALAYNGEYYLSLSTILPWLNAECENVKGKLLISSSAFEPSYYELCEYYTKYIMPFTNIEDYIGGNEKNNFLTLCGVMAANNLINFKSSVRKAFVTAAQYDSNPEYYSYEAYISAFIDMASNNSFSSNIAKKLMKGCKTLGKVNTLTKGMGIDLTELQIDDSVAAFMAEYGFDAEFQNLAYDFVDVVRGANTIAQQSQYIEPLAESVATFSAAFNTTKEYKDALQLLADEAKENTVLKDSAIDALSRIKNPYSVLYKKYMEFALDKGVDKLIIEKAVMKFMNFKVTDASLFITKMIIPNEFKAIDAYSKIIVYGDIEALSLDLVGSPRKAVEPEQQYTKRIGLLMKTLAVKKTLEALKSWKMMLLDEKMLTKQIEHCDEMVCCWDFVIKREKVPYAAFEGESFSVAVEASANIYREAFKDVKGSFGK